ncbi:hypothetical protein HDV00_010907 [Rhizophlyctis rosea]|nr:hypothetical protein HDV00_010907 [Rhizophlyctis rosea]
MPCQKPNLRALLTSFLSLPPFTTFNILLLAIVSPVSGSLLTAGLLNWVQPSVVWVEVNSQIVTALFTYLILTECPRRFRVSYWFIRARRAHGRQVKAAQGCETLRGKDVVLYREAVKRMKECYIHADPYNTGFLKFLFFCHLHTFLQIPINVMMWGFKSTVRPGTPLYILVAVSCLSGMGTGIYDGIAGKKVAQEKEASVEEGRESSVGSTASDSDSVVVAKEKARIALGESEPRVMIISSKVDAPEKVFTGDR